MEKLGREPRDDDDISRQLRELKIDGSRSMFANDGSFRENLDLKIVGGEEIFWKKHMIKTDRKNSQKEGGRLADLPLRCAQGECDKVDSI